MRVNELIIENWRNYGTVQVSFDGGVNVITGDNAQGKTNLLEAVFFLTSARAFRARTTKDAIKNGTDSARLAAVIAADGREQTLEARLRRSGRKELLINGVKKDTAAEFAGTLRAVLFCPDDLSMIRSGAAARRKLMDLCISQLRPRYAEALSRFSKAYEEKTRILRDYEEKPALLDFLPEYDSHLAVLSAELIRYRAQFVKALAPAAAAVHRDFSGGNEELTLDYTTVSTVDDPLRPVSELAEIIKERQRQLHSAELASRQCLVGAHKDDIEIKINGLAAKDFASQGQTRTAALSIKLAERELHFNDRGEYPVLLLDDVLSELDEKRQSFILNRITGGQVLITCCEDMRIAERTGGKVLRVTKGEIG